MKTLWTAVALSFLATSPGREEIAYGLEEDTTLLRSFVAEREDEIVQVSIFVDGEEVQSTDEVEDQATSLERVVVRDEILETEDGVPLDFRRTFVDLHQENTRKAGEEESEGTNQSDLSDVTIRFLWDDEDETYYAELDDEDDDVDADVLEHLTADMDLAPLLPDDEVDEGDSWEVDEQGYLTLMWPSGLVGWYDAEEEDGPDLGYSLQSVENLTGEGEATLEEIRDEDGVRVAVISVELTVETEIELDVSEEEEELGVTQTIEEERSVEGELLWDLDHGHLHSASFEASIEQTLTIAGPAAGPDGEEIELEQVIEWEGEVAYTATIERE